MTRALRPVIRLMESLAKSMVRMMGIEPKDELTSAFTVEEVQFMVAESQREGLIEFDRHGLTRRGVRTERSRYATPSGGVEDLHRASIGRAMIARYRQCDASSVG